MTSSWPLAAGATAGVYALPHYERPVIREIEEALARRRFRGIKIHFGECTLADYVVDPVLRLAGQRRVPCLIDVGGNLTAVERMAQTFPGTRLIVAHMGRYLSSDKKLIDRFIDLAGRFDNVFLDVSGVVLVEKIAEAVRRLGSARILWGTDGPHGALETITFAREELDKLRRLNVDEEAKKNLLGRNILNLLNLS
jgi:predicted TIM-barrel fold metal-dependent hydrolase